MWSQRTRAALARFAISLAAVTVACAARAQSVDLVAAGSLNLPLSEVAQAFTAATGIKVTQTYSPSGTLRQEIEAGLRPDVFASADTASPRPWRRRVWPARCRPSRPTRLLPSSAPASARP